MLVKRINVAMLSLLAMIVAGAIASASASATPQFSVNGKTFTGTETISGKELTPATLESKLPGGAKVKIVCPALQSKGGEIFENFKGKATSLEFYLCTVAEPNGCKVSSPIATGEISGRSVDVGTAGVSNQIVPSKETEGKKIFTTIKITGCAAEGAFKIGGSLECVVLEPAVESVLKGCQFTATSGSSLSFGVEPATLLGTKGAELTGTNKGKVWKVGH